MKQIYLDNQPTTPIDPKVFSANYKTLISLKSDAKLALIALNKKVKKNDFKGKEIVKIAKIRKFSEFEELVKYLKPKRRSEVLDCDMNVGVMRDAAFYKKPQ